MLPNWLYGKSKSKLQEILGGGGAPSDYNQVKAQITQNTEDIASLDDTLDTKAALTQISNPNLLDNPWFTVNQRGQSSYTELSKYTVDRWRTEGTSADFSIDIVSDGVQLKRNVSEGYLALSELNESTLLTPDKKYTLSILYSDGTVKSNTFTVPTYEQSYLRIVSTQSHMGCQAIIDRSVSGSYNIIVLYDGDISVSPTIRAVKLELGSVSTLAMDAAPNYATELAKCQRYFYKTLQFNNNGAIMSPNQCVAVATTRLQGIKFPTQMRDNPNITINKVVELDSSTPITGVTAQWNTKEGITYFSITGATVGSLYVVDSEASAEL